MAELDAAIVEFLNDLGPKGLVPVVDMAKVELFRNYCIQRFNWFKGFIKPGSDQHRCEKTWMRFYCDHGRLPVTISFQSLLSGVYTEEMIVALLNEIYFAYEKQYGFSIMNPDMEQKRKYMPLQGF